MIADLAITNGIIVLPDRTLKDRALLIDNDRIRGLGDTADARQVIDAAGGYITPGFIDLHYHGLMLIPDPEKIKEALRQDRQRLIRQGVTRFLPTLASATVPEWLKCLQAIREIIAEPLSGARPAGAHLEGIFLNPAAKGAHPENLLQPFDRTNPDHAAIFERFGDMIKMITFAPEMPGAEDLIQLCKQLSIVGAIGHSAATPQQVRSYAAAGIRHLTHLFNGMSGVHHRHPGVALAGLIEDDITADFIGDGVHVDPDVVRLIFRCRKPDDLILITDYVGLGDPDSEEPNYLPGGSLAGSHLSLPRAIGNVIKFTGAPVHDAVRMATLNAARLMGWAKETGSLEQGKIADVCVLDREMSVEWVIASGSPVIRGSS